MKKHVISFLSIASAVVALLSCAKEADTSILEKAPKAEGITINVLSGKDPTKTMAVDGEIPTIQWTNSDKICLFEVVDDTVKGSAESGDANIDGEGRASFSTTLGWEDPTGSAYQYSAVYPADNVYENGGKYYIYIPAEQTLTGNNFSEDSDVLFSLPLDHGSARVSDGEDVMFSFRRLGTVVRLSLAGITEGAKITGITLDAPTNIAGAIEYDPVTSTVNPESVYADYSSSRIYLDVDHLEATGNDVFWFRVLCDKAWAAGDKFTINVMTDKAVYEKEVTLPSAIKFPDGGLTKFSVNLEGCHPEPVQVPCLWDFEDSTTGWTNYDKDGDGYNWVWANGGTTYAHSGNLVLYSQSYDSGAGALSPDNWAVTPPIQLTEGNYLSFWVRPLDTSWPDSFAVYISNESPEGTMTTLLPLTSYPDGECAEWGPDGIYQHFIIQIPAEFDNEVVYIAFQHNCTNQYALILDDVAVTEEYPVKEATATYEDYLGVWAINSSKIITIRQKVQGESYSIKGLTGQGEYEVEAKFEDHRLVLYEQIVDQNGDNIVALQGSSNSYPAYPDGTPVIIFSGLYDKDENNINITAHNGYTYVDFFTYEGQTRTDDVYDAIPASLIPYVPDTATYIYYEDFESDISASWTFIDADGDGYLWGWKDVNTYSGDYALASYSYDNATYTPLHPDNWAFTPPVTLTSNNYLSFWVRGQDPSYPYEHYAVYITDEAPTADNLSGCTVLLEEQEYPNGNYVALAGDGYYQRYVLPIPASFEGKTVYVGFRHFNCSDMFCLALDDVAIAEGNPVSSAPAPSPAPARRIAAKGTPDSPFIQFGRKPQDRPMKKVDGLRKNR